MLTESSATGISTEIRRPTSCKGDGCLRVIPRPKIEMSITLQPWGPVDSLSILHVPSQRAGWRGTPRRRFMGNPSLVDSKLAVWVRSSLRSPLRVAVGQMLMWVVSVHTITTTVDVIFTPACGPGLLLSKCCYRNDYSAIAVAIPWPWVIAFCCLCRLRPTVRRDALLRLDCPCVDPQRE